ncbi:MAG: SseB family protein [Pseudomonadota bacterium]
MTETALDQAHAAMDAAPKDEAARLRFFERLADAELHVLLEDDAGETVVPKVFPLEDGPIVLAFDREDRLAAFGEGPVPHAILSGRTLAGHLAGQGLGLGLNLGVAPSSILLPAAAVGWLAKTVATAPAALEARPVEVAPPANVPEPFLAALDAKLPAAAGLARVAYLANVVYEGGATGHMLAFIEAHAGAEAALTQAVSEALVFSGLEAGAVDVAFLSASDALAARLARTALKLELPEANVGFVQQPPGRNPKKPPILR